MISPNQWPLTHLGRRLLDIVYRPLPLGHDAREVHGQLGELLLIDLSALCRPPAAVLDGLGVPLGQQAVQAERRLRVQGARRDLARNGLGFELDALLADRTLGGRCGFALGGLLPLGRHGPVTSPNVEEAQQHRQMPPTAAT